MNIMSDATIVYWHRQFPPLDAEPIGKHTIEAVSGRIPGTMADRDAMWQVCHANLMAHARMRMEHEVARLGGHYAHVFDEAIDSRRDDRSNEAWLHGRFGYLLYRRETPGVTRPETLRHDVAITGQARAGNVEGVSVWR